jgi:hypothetical protein
MLTPAARPRPDGATNVLARCGNQPGEGSIDRRSSRLSNLDAGGNARTARGSVQPWKLPG